jgi:hypothetical protein
VNDKVTAPDPRAELPLKLEVGKEYVTRERGEAVRILRVDRDGYHVGAFWSGIESFWLRDGRYYLPNDALDLIAEARPEVPTPSSAVPVATPFGWWVKYANGYEECVRYLPTDPDVQDMPSQSIPLFTTPVPDEAVRRLVEAVRAMKFDAWALTTPELQQAFEGRKSIVVIRPETTEALRTALAHPALRAFIGSEK